MDNFTSAQSASNICRGCGGQNAIKPLSVYGNVFKWCTSINVTSSDGLPTRICNRCWEMLTISYEFKVICTRTDRQWRTKNNSDILIESFPVLENAVTDDYEPFEIVDDVQLEEVVEETMLPGTPKEPFDCLYNTIPEIAEGIAIEVEETKEGELFKSEDLSNVESYSLPEYKTTLLKVDDCNQVIDQDAREDVEEFVLEDTVEYLEDTGKEMCPAQDSTPETHNEDVSIEVIKSESKLPISRSVRHSCPDCGKQFSSRTNVVRHQHSHRDSKPYQCDICKKEFTQSGTLKTHRYSHFDIKPFVCNVCGKRFTQSKSVKLHLRCHTGEKPYACDMCSAAFRQKNGLQRHMKVHAR
uniref:Uncharacterized protein n=2 Tax=Anopheles gambiae TaxID=7165 RepID=A0A1S4GC25_ANOGA